MSSEALYVPEEHLAEVVAIIRAGVKVKKPKPDVRNPLLAWCDDIDEYLERLTSDAMPDGDT